MAFEDFAAKMKGKRTVVATAEPPLIPPEEEARIIRQERRRAENADIRTLAVQEPEPQPPPEYRDREDLRGKATYLPDIHRLLPQSQDAEMGVLGSILIAPQEVMGECIQKGVTADLFHVPAHAAIFTVVQELYNANRPIDFILLTQWLRDLGELDKAGGPAFVTSLFTFVPTAANAAYYIEILKEKHALRQIIITCNEFAARSYEEQGNVDEFIDSVEKKVQEIAHSRLGGAAPASSLITLSETQIDDSATLLGNRFLCRGGGMLFIGPSGIGKSSASVQQDMLWALGCPAFGIKPTRPLRILTIQAENDDGDLTEMARGVIHGLNVTDDDKREIHSRVFYRKQKGLIGEAFIRALGALLAKDRPDILRIDPLMAFLGADVTDNQAMAAFCRAGLDPLLERYHCAAIVNHHTPKVVNRDTSSWRASDWMYAGAGASDMTNWARAALVIDPTHTGHVFNFMAAKRGNRIGWLDADGQPTTQRSFCHSFDGGIFWREASEQDLAEAAASSPGKDKGPSFSRQDILNEMSLLTGVKTTAIFKRLKDEMGITKSTFYRLWNGLKNEKKIEERNGLYFKSQVKR